MPDTYTRIHIHAVFSVRGRRPLILASWKDELYKYITGIVQNQGHKLLCINGVEDHLHLFIGMKPVQSISALMQDIKGDSSKWINKNQKVQGRFSWQAGYGAFSYSLSQVPVICRYIENQEQHHRKKTFEEEYLGILEKFLVNDNKDRFVTEDV